MDLENQKNLLTINGRLIGLRPDTVLDGPYIGSRKGSGIVTI